MDNSVPQQQQQPQGPDMEDIAFTAKLNNVRPLVNMLRAVNINTRGQCTINASGVVFSSEESRCMVAHAYMKKSQFSQFGFNPIPNQNQKDDQAQQEDDENEEDDMVFGLHIETLIECLGLFLGPSNSNAPSSRAQASSFIGADASGAGGSTMPGYANLSLYKGATTVKLAYDGPGSDFELMLEDSGVISVCRLATFEPQDLPDLSFAAYEVIQQAIMKSEWFIEAFKELDQTSEFVTISMANTAPFLKLQTVGTNGSLEMAYSKGGEVMDQFYCKAEQENRYKLSLIMKTKTALYQSTRIKISINDRGFLSLEFMVPTEAEVSFVTFVFAPLVIHSESI